MVMFWQNMFLESGMQHCFLQHKDNVPDLLLYELWDRLCDSGTAKTVFYDGSVNSHHGFRDFMRRDENQMFAVYYDGEPAGAVWLNDIRFANARVHGFFCKELWGRKRDGGVPKSILAGRFAMATLLRTMAFDVLYGFIPCWNRVAIKFSLQCGARQVGVLPYGVWTDKGSVDAVVLATTKETTEDAWTAL